MRAHHLLAALLLLSAACAYESSTIESLRCAPEGARETGRVCQSGVWVQDGTILPDAPEDQPDDGEPDTPEEMCVPLPDSFYCEQAGAQCGTLTRVDNCGVTRPVPCGECEVGECGAAGPNLCQCDCEIDGVCRGAGMPNPDNACQVCDPEVSANAWSPHNAGGACDGTNTSECNPGTCDDMGACIPATEACAAFKTDCLDAICEADRCITSARPANTLCATSDPTVAGCERGECDGAGGCQVVPIAGTCIFSQTQPMAELCLNDDDTPPTNACRACNGATGQLADLDQPSPADGCGVSDACTRYICRDGQCDDERIPGGGCIIDNVCYEHGALRPGMPCQRCDANDDNPDQWKNAQNNTICDSNLNDPPQPNTGCSRGACNNDGICRPNIIINVDRCLIDGLCRIPNSPGDNTCQYCDPTLNQRAWTTRAAGFACTNASSQSCMNEMDDCECTSAGVCAP